MKKEMLKEYNLSDDMQTFTSSDKEIVEFSEKWENFIMETLKEANKLHTEGSEIHAANVLAKGAVRDRNRYMLARLGALKATVQFLTTIYQKARQET